MRNLIKLPLLLCLIILAFAACNDKKSPKDLIVRKWKMIDIKGPEFDEMSDSSKTALLKNTSMEFTSDGKYKLQGVEPELSTGTYSLSEDGKKLTVTPDKTKETETDDVNELTKDRMAVTDKMGVQLICVPFK